MDDLLAEATGKMIATGGGYLVAAILLMLLIVLWRRLTALQDALLRLSGEQGKSAAEQTNVLQLLREELRGGRRR